MLLRAIPRAEDGASRWHMNAFHAVFGDPIDAAAWAAADPLELARKADPARVPPLRFDCGASDRYGLAAGAEELHRRLEARGVAHQFELPPGDHGYDYVRSVLRTSLRFALGHVGGAPPVKEKR
jgi:S-formylglutathione hydrolase FrmB